jgi:hypothetical protein
MNKIFVWCWWISPAITCASALAQKMFGMGFIGYWIIPVGIFVVLLGLLMAIFGFLASFRLTTLSSKVIHWIKALISLTPFMLNVIAQLPQRFSG